MSEVQTVQVTVQVANSECNRCHQKGLGWAISRRTGRHYLVWPTADRPQGHPGMLHKCGETFDQSAAQMATWQAAKAAEKAVQPLPSPQPAPTPVPASTAAPAAQPVKATKATKATKSAQPVKVETLPVSMTKVTGPVEAAVTAAKLVTDRLVANGIPAEVAASLANQMTADQLTAVLLK